MDKTPHYAELFCQSNFSFLEGASHADELMIQASFLGYQALAITDECSVAGIVKAYTAIKEHQLPIKLIAGSLFRLEELELILLCPHRKAYAELCRLISKARRRAKKGRIPAKRVGYYEHSTLLTALVTYWNRTRSKSSQVAQEASSSPSLDRFATPPSTQR